MKIEEVVQKSAIISEDGKYRYRLDRWWGEGRRLVFLMMNPSTADADKDDATIRKCMGFARRWNYDGITVVNLFSLRSRDPNELVTADDPRGPEHFKYLIETLLDPISSTEVICAWGCESTLRKVGTNGFTLWTKAAGTINHLQHYLPGKLWMCLGRTQGGTPRHPLMLAYSTQAEDYA